MKHITLGAIACGILLFAACSKSEDNPTPGNNTTTPSTKSKKELVVDGKWKWTEFATVYNKNGKDSLVDGWSQIKECDKDDIMTFAADGTGTIDEMANKCDNDPQTKSITWELLNNETQVKVTDDKGPAMLTIIELTATKATYRQRVAVGGGDSMTVQQVFTNVK